LDRKIVTEKNKPDLEAAYGLDSPDANQRLYRDWATTYDEDFARRSGYRFARLIADAFQDAGGKGPVLDAGCGTGLVADHLPSELVIDGVDISPEMLVEAKCKGRYRELIEADLTKPLPIPSTSYAGLTSSGTFTHGHVGPEAIRELLRVLQPDAVCAISGNPAFFEEAGFEATFNALVEDHAISRPTFLDERIYDAGATPPDGHENDIGYVIVFNRL
jgi:SAM-dependent methyltransferase